jgi:alanyl-tRNA synthetase
VNVLRKEEEMFLRTLDKGLSKFKRLAAKAKDGVISGKDAWVLSDTYGFPLDLTVRLSFFIVLLFSF